MKAVKIKDSEHDRNILAVDLRHVLVTLGERAFASDWRVRDVWAIGQAESELASLNEQQVVSGRTLTELAENVSQVIDGTFSAFESSSDLPWVVIEAVDSSFYVVHSDDPATLDRIRNAFQQVTDYKHKVA